MSVFNVEVIRKLANEAINVHFGLDIDEIHKLAEALLAACDEIQRLRRAE